jgi:hypothetical protein
MLAGMPRGRRLVMLLVGTALVAGNVLWIGSGSDHQVAAMALCLAAIAIWWTIFFGARLESVVREIAADVRRIADALAPAGSESEVSRAEEDFGLLEGLAVAEVPELELESFDEGEAAEPPAPAG